MKLPVTTLRSGEDLILHTFTVSRFHLVLSIGFPSLHPGGVALCTVHERVARFSTPYRARRTFNRGYVPKSSTLNAVS